MEKNRKNSEIAFNAREEMIAAISKAIQEVSDETLKAIYVLVIHVR